jgi:Glutaminase
MPRRFPPPWSIEERQESFIVKDANGQQLAYLYFEDEPQRQMSMKRLSRDEAFLIAVNIAKLPSVPRQILKDIPRPPNSASRPLHRFLIDCHTQFRDDNSGAVADYIPQLKKVDPRYFGVSLATIDGHVYEVGDSAVPEMPKL